MGREGGRSDGLRAPSFGWWRSPEVEERQQGHGMGRRVMSTNAYILVDSVGLPSAEVCRTAASFP
jgi:hypothetical protein